MATARGVPCPVCDGKEKTEYVALLPFTPTPPPATDITGVAAVTLQPQNYAVGKSCYRKQWKYVYGEDEKCPV